MADLDRQKRRAGEYDKGPISTREEQPEGPSGREARLLSLHRTLGNSAMARAATQFKTRQVGPEGLAAAMVDMMGPEVAEKEADKTPALPQSGGAGLPLQMQKELAPQAGTELHDVQVHAGPSVHSALAGAGAEAATQGTNVYLGQDVDLQSARGKDTLLHELRHVGQQKRGEASALDGAGGDPQKREELERDADRR